MGFLDLDLPCDIRDIIADVRNLAQADEIKLDMIAMLALDAIGLVPMIGALKYSDETAEAVASGEKLLKESGTIYESFADMMSPDDAAKYLDFLENGSREGLTSAELAGVEKADGTWHHHEDGVTLQEVETILHDRFRHRGGISNLKKK